MNESDIGAGPALSERHPEGVEDEVGAHVIGELPADDRAAVGVDHEREIDDAFPAAQVGEVREPRFVRAGRGEVALDEIRRPPGRRVGAGRPPRQAAPFGSLYAVTAHQPLHPAAACVLTGTQQSLPHPPRAVREVVPLVHLPDPSEQPLVLELASRTLAASPLVVRGRRHAQGLTDRLDPEALALLVDERAHLGRCGSSSPAK